MRRVGKSYLSLIITLLTPMAEAAAQTSTRTASDLIELEMLTRAEHRAEAFRAQLLDLRMQEVELQARLEDLDYLLRAESIQKAVAFVGSVRPMDEVRNELRTRLDNEKGRVGRQLELLGEAQARLEAAFRDAEAACLRLRKRLGLTPNVDACERTSETIPVDGDNSLPSCSR